MIFVTVGMSPNDFTRLVKAVDELTEEINEEIIYQTGFTKYIPENGICFDFTPRQDFIEYYKKARYIIGHAGEGTIINALKYRKPIIVMPRSKKFNEHCDDHQKELAGKISETGKIIMVENELELKDAIKIIKNNKYEFKEDKSLVNNLANYLSTVGKQVK